MPGAGKMPWLGVSTGFDCHTMGRIPTFIDAGKHSNSLSPPEPEATSVTELTDISNNGQQQGQDPFCTGGAYPAATPGTSGESDRKRNKVPPEGRYWTWGSTQASVASILCCPLLAVFGVWYSVKAYQLHKIGEYNKSWKLKKVAWSFAVASLLLGIIMWLTFVAVFWSY